MLQNKGLGEYALMWGLSIFITQFFSMLVRRHNAEIYVGMMRKWYKRIERISQKF